MNGGLGRGFYHGSGRDVNQVHTARIQQDRQEEEWSVPSNVERRENDMERHESPRTPCTPPQRIDYLLIGVVLALLEKGHHLKMLQ